MNTSSEFDTDVVVVGSGPRGGTTALALASHGVRVHVVSKWKWVANTPRAHIINQRAVEVLRDLGVEEDAKLEAGGSDPSRPSNRDQPEAVPCH